MVAMLVEPIRGTYPRVSVGQDSYESRIGNLGNQNWRFVVNENFSKKVKLSVDEI